LYTEREDLDAADIIVTSLGEPGGEKGILKKSNRNLEFEGCFYIETLINCFSRQPPSAPHG